MHEFFSTLNTKPTEIFLCDKPLVNLLPPCPHPGETVKRMAEGMSSRHRQCLSATLRLCLSLVPSSLAPPLSHKLPLCSPLWKSPAHTISPRPCWTVNPHSVCSNTAAPCSLPISTRAKQDRTDGQPRSHSSTSVYLKPPSHRSY